MCITVYWLPGTNYIPKTDCAKVILTVCSVCHISCALLCTDCHGLTSFQRLTVSNSSWHCFFHTWCALLCTAMDKLHSKPWLCQTHLDRVSVSILGQEAYIYTYIQKWCVTLAAFILGVHCCVLPWTSFITQTLTINLSWQCSVCHISCALLCTDLPWTNFIPNPVSNSS